MLWKLGRDRVASAHNSAVWYNNNNTDAFQQSSSTSARGQLQGWPEPHIHKIHTYAQ